MNTSHFFLIYVKQNPETGKVNWFYCSKFLIFSIKSKNNNVYIFTVGAGPWWLFNLLIIFCQYDFLCGSLIIA